MKTKLLILSYLIHNCVFTPKSYTQNTIKWIGNIGYSIELTDSYRGIIPKSQKTDYADFYNAQLIIQKKWYGVGLHLDIIKNTYYMKYFSFPYSYEYLLPNYINGCATGISTNIYPFLYKRLSLRLFAGLNYVLVKNKTINSYSFIVNTGELIKTDYSFDKISEIGFFYGPEISYSIFRNLSISANMKFFESKEFRVITSGLSITYQFNQLN